MPTKRSVLAQLKRDELIAAVEWYELEVADRQVRAQLVDALAHSKKARLTEILLGLKRARLKDICAALDLDTGGREKSLLVERLTGSQRTSSSGAGRGASKAGRSRERASSAREPVGAATGKAVPATAQAAADELKGMTPRDFLKARRPHLFSDSEPVVETELPKKIFEYHLDTITSRKEEVEFENFCRRVAQREICPNLRPQTGPTGGGDSKSDSTSYEIDPALAQRVFWGSPALPTQERWCFAYSAKKDWSGKVRSDVKGLAAIVPPPDKIYFITSRYARDKKRGEVEAELIKLYGIPVEILDREWLLTKTYENGHTDLAAECFHIGDGREVRRLGPKDAGQEAELTPLLGQLKKPDEHYSSKYVLVDEYLRAAYLARSVERPRHDVEGLLAQAIRLAGSTTPQQLLRAQYDLAWTSFWWFEDPDATLAAYKQMEKEVAGLDDAQDLELHTNVLNVLLSAVARGRLGADAARLADRFDALAAAADRMAADRSRPANALHARTCGSMIELTRAQGDNARVTAALDELHDCLTSADGLVHYPLLDIADSLEKMREFLSEFSSYDRLFDALCDLRGRLLGDREKAAMLLRNGFRLYEQERHEDALRALGAARRCALEKDSVLLLADTSLVMSLVYEASGLYWAARMELAMAAHLAITDAKREAYASRRAVMATLRLVWVELRLGRIPCALAWRELSGGLIHVLDERGEDVASFLEQLRDQDGVLALFFVVADEGTLRYLTRLPDTLDRLGLNWARWALLFALGHEDVLLEEGFQNAGEESPGDVYALAFNQPALADIPAGRPTLHAASFDSVETDLLGMKLRFEHENEVSPIAFAENLISASEAWFATATWEDLLFFRSSLTIRVRQQSLASNELPDVEQLLSEDREIRIGPTWASAVHDADVRDQGFHDWVLRFLAGITAQAMPRPGGGMEGLIEKLAASESFTRALTYLPVSRVTLDDLGADSQMLEHWDGETEYPMRRPEAWWRDSLERERAAAVAQVAKRPHSRPTITVGDLIEVEMWDRAKWHMALQIVAPDAPDQPPVLGFVFHDADVGAEIFSRLRERLEESGERLRVAVILGKGGAKCDHYAITIGPDFATAAPPPPDDPNALYIAVTRVLQLTRSSDTLGMFLDDAKAKGEFVLVPACRDGAGWKFCWAVGIECTKLVVRDASEVGATGDQDAVAARGLLDESDPRSASSSKNSTHRRKAATKKKSRTKKSRKKKSG